MQTTFYPKRKQQGNVLVVTLFILSLMGFFLYAYLDTTRTQRSLMARSQGWNTALGLAEAGVEEALGQVNPGAPLPVIDRTANGWGAAVDGLYGPISRSLSNGTYSVVISADIFPIIYATGYVAVPSIPANLTRVVRVTTTNMPLFTTVLAAKYDINFTGNGISTDSFNSSNPNQSDNGRYPVLYPSRASTNGDVASVQGLINVGNGNINGTLYLGPTATDTIGGNGIVTGGVSNDFNVELEDVVLPSTTWLQPSVTNVTIGTNTYQYLFGPGTSNGSGDFTIADLKNSSIYVSNATVRLKLTGNASPTLIQVAGVGTSAGSLTIYMDGPSFTLSGKSTVDGGLAASLSYYGTTNNTSITFGGNASFTGTIYAPEAAFSMGGGGSSIYDFVGAAVLKSAVLNGHYNFHYDEALATTGPKRGYVPNSWQEL
ncbi:MAG TPA: hypothetical protein VL361_22595 [Candidatus Limnocylindrales bacterium]|jgi:hypothetical protein|nr:hypothetical protein [Candidatus Limnocylindrales bacterium]